MTEDEQRRMEREAPEERPEDQQDERVDDLDVPDDESQDVKGGGNTKSGNIEL